MGENKGRFTFCVEFCGVWFQHTYQLYLSLANFFTLSRLVLLTQLDTNIVNSFLSLSSFFQSIVWLERELRELEGFFIRGLQDTRRLLQDYFLVPQAQHDYTQYITLGYNHMLQEVL